MSSTEQVGDTAALDAAITAERTETKFLVVPQRLPALARAVAARLPPHRFSGEGANRLPGAEHHVTTIYFDTPSRAYYEAARADHQSHVKLRAKEYYDLHPALAELATDPEQIVRYQPWLWFELKRREGLITSKRRLRFPKAAAASLFRQRERNVPLSGWLAERGEALALIEHVRAQPERIAPSALVNYRRQSFQSPDGMLRVTIDLGLAFYAVPDDLFERTRPLARRELGAPVGSESRAVVEVKRLASQPEWLTQALSAAAEGPDPFSKFLAASEAVHGA